MSSMPSTPPPEAPVASWPARAGARLRALWPDPLRINTRERLRIAVGAMLGLLLTAVATRWLAPHLLPHWAAPGALWLVAPLGASAVLVFGVPTSPLAQPWPVVGGNTVSALVGVLCAWAVPDPLWAGPLAVGLALVLMMALRCLHPPGGACALLAVLAHTTEPGFVLSPVLLNSLLLVSAGVAYHHATGRRYPHAQRVHEPSASARFSAADLDAAMRHYNQVLDISPDDLQQLLQQAEVEAYRRTFGGLLCRDIMTPTPVTVAPGTPLPEAWALMRAHDIKALPVVDQAQQIVGIVTRADFLRQADPHEHQGLGQRLKAFVSGKTPGAPEVVAQIMSRHVRVMSESRKLVELVPLFSDAGHHHIPIINAQQRLVGIITQSDLVRALYQAVSSGVAEPDGARPPG